MSDKDQITKHKLTGGMLLFAASFLLYSLASSGNLPGDTEIRWSVSRQIVRGTVAIEDGVAARNYAVGTDGRRYCFWGLGQSLCLVPFAALGLLLEKLTQINPKMLDLSVQFLVSVVFFPVIGALMVWLMYHLAVLLGYSEKASILAAVVLAFGTMHFHYSISTHEQTQVGLLLLLGVMLLVKHHQERRFVYAWLLCVVLGLCLLFRLGSATVILPIYLTAAGAEILARGKTSRAKQVGKWLAAGVCGTVGIVIVVGWYNYTRFGSVLESGYALCTTTTLGGHDIFESSPFPTLAAMLFSPGKSIFLYNPVLLLLPVCVYGFYRRHKMVTLAVFVAITGSFVFHSFHTTWAGDYAWSTRYQVPVLPLLVLPLVFLFSRSMKTMIKILVIALISISCVIQLASVVYNFNLEFVQNPNHHLIPDSYVWDWSQSHLWKRFENIIRHTTGNRDFSSVKVTEEEPLLLKYNYSEQSVRNQYYVNFFPFKARSMLPSTKLFYPLLCIWLVLLVGFCVVVFKLFQFYIGQKAENSTLPVNIPSGAEECR